MINADLTFKLPNFLKLELNIFLLIFCKWQREGDQTFKRHGYKTRIRPK